MATTIMGVMSICILCISGLEKIAAKKQREYEIQKAKEEGYEVYFFD